MIRVGKKTFFYFSTFLKSFRNEIIRTENIWNKSFHPLRGDKKRLDVPPPWLHAVVFRGTVNVSQEG